MALVISVLLLSYLGRIRVAAANAMVLAVRLLKSAPAHLNPQQRKKLDALQKAGETVEAAQAVREDGDGAAVQPLRTALASCVAALDMALEALSLLPVTLTDKSQRALKARAIIFPDGRSFVNGTAGEATMYVRRTIARIEQKKLGSELKDLIGPEFLKAMQGACDDLAEAIGIGEGVKDTPSATAISRAMDKYTTALAAYTRALSADVNDEDEESVQAFLKAVAPIDEYRSTYTADGSGDGTTQKPGETSTTSATKSTQAATPATDATATTNGAAVNGATTNGAISH